MSSYRHFSSVGRRSSHKPLLAVVFVAVQLACSAAQAATFGHSRLVSATGEPLRINIPVTEISPLEIESLRIDPAPASAWTSAGLIPPVDLASLQARLADGHASGTRVVQVSSDQVFNQPIADLLLDIRTSSGVQRYQVSLLARGGTTAVQAPSAQTAAVAGQRSSAEVSEPVIDKPVLIRRGDTMFAVAQRHAVPGVTVYQMMLALHRANPQAFIYSNMNLVKAGERLTMPDMAALTAISDREARRLFHEHVVAFNAYRQGSGDSVFGDLAAVQQQGATHRNESPVDAVSNVPSSRVAPGDQLKLSSGRTAGASATGAHQADVTTTEPAAAVQQQTQAGGGGNPAANTAAEGSQNAHAATAGPTSSTSSESSTGSTSSTSPESSVGSAASNGAALPAVAGSAAGQAAAHGSQHSQLSAQSGNVANADDGSQADDAMASRKAIDDATFRVSQLEENVKNLNQALQSQGEAAKDVVVDGAIGLRQSLTDVATAVTDATIGDEDFPEGSPDSKQTNGSVAPNAQSGTQQSNEATSTMDSITTWLHANLIGVITALLALVVLIIAWVLRRANIAQTRTDAVTPEMVKEKLDQINLDLNEPTIDDSTSSRS